MKKFIIALVAVFALGTTAMAQSAIGLRLGGGVGYGAEISGMIGVNGDCMSKAQRVELDLGWSGYHHGNYLNLSGAYQWQWNIVKGFGWFVGPGLNLGFWTGHADDFDGGFGLAVGGQIGLEYDFDFPLQLTVDFRPMWSFLGYGGFWGGGALGVRYRF